MNPNAASFADLLPAEVLHALRAVPRWGDGLPHLITGLEPGLVGLDALLDLAEAVRGHAPELARSRPLAGRVVSGLFFDPSLRTRTSMAVACARLGAEWLDLQAGKALWTLEFADEVPMAGSAAEHVREAAGTLGRYADVLGLRSFPGRGRWDHERTQPVHRAFAEHAGVPVVNLEGAWAHPSQGLTDALTLRDLGASGRFVLSWVPHPEQQAVAVAHSALWAAASQGMEVVLAHPRGFDLDEDAVAEAGKLAQAAGGSLSVTHDRNAAFEGAEVVYARSWGALKGLTATVGGHADALASLRDWSITERDLKRGPARLMHALPVRRGVEVSDGVLDSDASVVLKQAENRVWAQAALLLSLLRGEL